MVFIDQLHYLEIAYSEPDNSDYSSGLEIQVIPSDKS